MMRAIPQAHGVVLRHTGLMFRFTHPITYSKVVDRFIAENVDRVDVRPPLRSNRRVTGGDRSLALNSPPQDARLGHRAQGW